jgi:membrane associated rhomboid family serine protease
VRPEVKTCPDCGALITPQLVKCRHCGRYLHGTKLEGLIFEHLLPEGLRGSPGTGMMMMLSVLYYVLMAMFAGFENAIAFSGYSVRALGGVSVPEILSGEYWRFVTSMLGHHDVVHIAFNLYALSTLGRLVEEAFDKKKMLIIYLISGSASMAISYAWHVYALGEVTESVGASGAVCGMLGAALVGAHRIGPIASDVKRSLIRWGVYLLIFGLVISGIDNAAHVGGFVVGGAIAYLIPLGIVQNVGANRALSVLTLSMFAGVLFCIAQMLLSLRGASASLEADLHPRGVLFFNVYPGVDNPEFSSQHLLLQDCQELLDKDPKSDHTVEKCEIARRANPYQVALYQVLADVHQQRGETDRAEKMRSTAERLAPLVRKTFR